MKRELLVALGLSVGLGAAWGCGEPDEEPSDDVGIEEDAGGEDDAGDVGGEGDADVENDGGDEDTGDGGGSDVTVDVAGVPEGRTYFRSVSGVLVTCEEGCEVACELSLDGGEAETVACAEGEAFDLEGLEYGEYQLDVVVDGEVATTRSFEVHPPEWASVSAGDGYTCAILLDGHMACFGDGLDDQLGAGENGVFAEAQLVDGEWASVSAGNVHTCGISAAGELYCWGSDAFGALGHEEGSGSVPQRVGDASDWESVSANMVHTCGIRAGGALYCWGSNLNGALGLGSEVEGAPTPTQVEVDGVSGWAEVTAGNSFTCALTDGGALYCWGIESSGVVGPAGDDVFEPQAYQGDLIFSSLDAGHEHTCGVVELDAGRQDAYCWGEGRQYKLGTSETRRENSPTPRAVGSVELTSVVSGYAHSCGLAADGTLHCWGHNSFGQLGFDPVTAEFPFPAQVGEESWERLSAGLHHTCGVRASDKSLLCWGRNLTGALGRGEVGEDPLFEAEVIAWPY